MSDRTATSAESLLEKARDVTWWALFLFGVALFIYLRFNLVSSTLFGLFWAGEVIFLVGALIVMIAAGRGKDWWQITKQNWSAPYRLLKCLILPAGERNRRLALWGLILNGIGALIYPVPLLFALLLGWVDAPGGHTTHFGSIVLIGLDIVGTFLIRVPLVVLLNHQGEGGVVRA